MHFTREPIIETVISSKDGCKLLIRSSRGNQGTEEYYVDAIEVVSFGHGFFFRSQERPKSFLLPISDYEVVEVKEQRLSLKTSSGDRQSIKIGGGKKPRAEKEAPAEEPAPEGAISSPALLEEAQTTPAKTDRRRDRRRRRHRKSADIEASSEGTVAVAEGAEQAVPAVLPSLIPPPSILISQTLSRYKLQEGGGVAPMVAGAEKVPVAKDENPSTAEKPSAKKEEKVVSEVQTDDSIMQKRSIEDAIASSTHFTSIESDRDFYSF